MPEVLWVNLSEKQVLKSKILDAKTTVKLKSNKTALVELYTELTKTSLSLQARKSKSAICVTIAFKHSRTPLDITYVNDVM